MREIALPGLSGRRAIGILAFLCAVALGFSILVIYQPSGLASFFLGPFAHLFSFGNMLNRAALLCLSALAASLAFKAGIIHLGGEGFIYLGAVTGFALARLLPPSWGILAFILPALASMAAGAFAGSLPSCMRRLSGRDELITSFLLSQALLPLLDWAVSSPLRDPKSQIIATAFLRQDQRPTLLLSQSSLNTSALISLLACFLFYLFLYRSRGGLLTRLSGHSRKFVEYSGHSTESLRFKVMAFSSAIMGLCGFLAMSGDHGRVIRGFSSGLGWSGLACAIVARSNPFLLPLAALLFAYIDAGTKSAQMTSGLPGELAAIIQALIFFAAASGRFSERRDTHA